MEKLFGIPINQLLVALLVVFALAAVAMGVAALRNRVILKLAVRNVPRRWTQTALIVLGLMLATILFSASFATGDTLTHSIRVQAVERLGQVDVMVRAEDRDASGRLAYFDQVYVQQVREALSGQSEVEGVAPMVQEQVPVVAPASRLSEPRVDLLGLEEEWTRELDPLVDSKGHPLALAGLKPGQAYVSSELAVKLEVGEGGAIAVFLGSRPTTLSIAGTYTKGAHPAGELSVVMPLAHLQALTGNNGRVNSIVVSNRGDAIEGARHAAAVVSRLKPVLAGAGLEAEAVKQDALDEADQVGSMFSTVFLLFGQFSIAAGILLIFLIFVMLAAERKRELGIARAVGTQRGHVVGMFAFEGTTYALMAAAIGSLLGIAVGWGMIRIMAAALGQADLQLAYSFNWRSVVIAFTLGMVLTVAVVLVSSWRVSRLNIVRAIRDIPEPPSTGKGKKGLVFTALLVVMGLVLSAAGLQSEQASPFMLGTSLLIIAIPLLARRLRLPDRAAYTIAGVGLVVWWLLPFDALEGILPEMGMGIEMFFLSGIMVVLGAVWTVIYNSDVLLNVTVYLFGRVPGLPAILKTAVSYPMQSRFRTGVTLAMFSLVVFTLMVMAFILYAISGITEDTERLSGGFHIRANTSYANPVADLKAALPGVAGVSPDSFEAVASFSGARVKVKQDGSVHEPVDYLIQGVDAEYSGSVSYGFSMMAHGYGSPRQVWQELQARPGTAVVSAGLVPAKTNFNVGAPSQSFRLEGFWLDDEVLPEVYILATDPRSGKQQPLRVIGVLEEGAVYISAVMTSQDTVNTLLAQPAPPQAYMLRLKPGVDAGAVARALKAGFLEHGMQAEVTAEEIRKSAGTSIMVNNLLQGFMGLGLVVGIAALGVIAARSVVERRQQIGVLRALGFQKGMVQLSFLLESSFVAVLGIAIGTALGFGLSYNVVKEMSTQLSGIEYRVPWANVVLVIAIAYVASLLTTFLPARQAANVYPAEALRYE